MKIWVDADACPRAAKDILFRVAERTKTELVFVANSWLKLPNSAYVSLVQVGDKFDEADDEIVKLCEAGDLVITADIPLASRIVEKSAFALNPRGTLYDKHNIGEILSKRDFMHEMRSAGVETGGPSGFGKKNSQEFANALDRFLARG